MNFARCYSYGTLILQMKLKCQRIGEHSLYDSLYGGDMYYDRRSEESERFHWQTDTEFWRVYWVTALALGNNRPNTIWILFLKKLPI